MLPWQVPRRPLKWDTQSPCDDAWTTWTKRGNQVSVEAWMFHMKEKGCGEPWASVRMSGKHPCQEERCWNGEGLRTRGFAIQLGGSCASHWQYVWHDVPKRIKPHLCILPGWLQGGVCERCLSLCRAAVSGTAWKPNYLRPPLVPLRPFVLYLSVWRSILVAIRQESLGDGQAYP